MFPPIQIIPFIFISSILAILRLHCFGFFGQHYLDNCFLDQNCDSTLEIIKNLFVGKKEFFALGIPEEPVHETSRVNVPRLADIASVHFGHCHFLVGTVKLAGV